MPLVNEPTLISRRRLLRGMALGVTVAPLAVSLSPAFGADGALLSPAEPAAKAVQYVEDARGAKGATAGNKCANCALYLGPTGAAQGPCQLFAGKQVKAAGWCSSWAPQM
jgi:hypothetical protein